MTTPPNSITQYSIDTNLVNQWQRWNGLAQIDNNGGWEPADMLPVDLPGVKELSLISNRKILALSPDLDQWYYRDPMNKQIKFVDQALKVRLTWVIRTPQGEVYAASKNKLLWRWDIGPDIERIRVLRNRIQETAKVTALRASKIASRVAANFLSVTRPTRPWLKSWPNL